jgi:hypothetical protein
MMEEKVYLYKVELKRCQFCDSEVNILATSGYPNPSEKKCVSDLIDNLKKHFINCKEYRYKSIINFKLISNKITKSKNLNTYSSDVSVQKLII